jgi:hypothetical protein
MERIVKGMPDLSQLYEEEGESKMWEEIQTSNRVQDPDHACEVPSSAHVLFSAAGTGKTRHAFDVLRKRFGLYFLSPNLAPVTEREFEDGWNSNPPTPSGAFGSRDAYTLYQSLLKFQGQTALDQRILSLISADDLISARSSLLIRWLHCQEAPRPRDWLWLQISCSQWDTFDALYRLFRLADSDVLADSDGLAGEMPLALMKDWIYRVTDKTDLTHEVPIVLDEAQTSLNNTSAELALSRLYTAVLTIYTSSMVDEDPPDLGLVNPTLVITGTSFDKVKMQKKPRHHAQSTISRPRDRSSRLPSWQVGLPGCTCRFPHYINRPGLLEVLLHPCP